MKLNNKYYILRHGEAMSNIRQVVSSWPEKFKNPLTKHGKEMVMSATEILKEKKIDLIFTSPLLRTKETAQIVGKELNMRPRFDKRLREVGFGAVNGRPAEELLYLGFEKERLKKSIKRSETYKEVLERVYDFLRETDKKHKGKNILIVSHQCPLWILENKVKGFSLTEGLKRNPEEKRIGKAELRELN
ncbi:MAG: histidine phosphatase family protein [bacterium]|nr:histidine phosphatase family protein [bacterium]